jgi:thioesterase domain-containing protein
MRAAKSSLTSSSPVSPLELQRYLYREIPLSAAMGARVVAVGVERVVLEAPLEPNVNHRRTVFGGSAGALAMLSSWALVHVRLQREHTAGTLVIQRNTMEFERAIAGSFAAEATLPDPERWQPFLELLRRRGRARIAVSALVRQREEIAARFNGEFVALNPESA